MNLLRIYEKESEYIVNFRKKLLIYKAYEKKDNESIAKSPER